MQSVLWPLVPTVTAIALPSCIALAYRDLELSAARPHVHQRAIFAFVAVVVSFLASLGGLRFDIAIALRNGALLTGLSCCSVVLLPPRIAWMPPALVPMVMWLFGLSLGGSPRPWALLLLPGSSLPALLIAVVLLVAGLGLFVGLRVPLWAAKGDPGAG